MQRVSKRKQHTSRQETSAAPWKTALWGLIAAVLVTAIGVLLSSAAFYAGWIPAGTAQYRIAAYTIMALSLLIGMFFVLRKTRGKDRLLALIVAAGYFGIRMALSAVFTFL